MSFLLVHGAGMAASCWDYLLPLLAGPTIAVDLPGRGKRSNRDTRGVTLDDCAAAIIEDAADLTDIVMVAHSFAGVSVPRVLPELAGRIAHVVFLSAVVPPHGTRVLDQIDPAVQAAVKQSIVGGVYHQDRSAAIAMLCNDMSPEQTEWTADQVIDDSAALLEEAVDLSGLSADLPRTYVRLTKDACYSPDLQSRSADLVGGSTRFLESGHMPMVSIPNDLAALLDQVRK